MSLQFVWLICHWALLNRLRAAADWHFWFHGAILTNWFVWDFHWNGNIYKLIECRPSIFSVESTGSTDSDLKHKIPEHNKNIPTDLYSIFKYNKILIHNIHIQNKLRTPVFIKIKCKFHLFSFSVNSRRF